MRSSVPMVIALCVVVGAARADEIITFDTLDPDAIVYNQYGQQGVIFPHTPRIIAPDNIQAHSGNNVLTNYRPGEEFGGDLVIEFTAPQTRVKVWLGLLHQSGGNQVEVRAWALNENDQQLGYRTVQLGPGPADVDTPIEFTPHPLPKIRKLKISYRGGHFPVIDDLEFSAAGPAPADDQTAPQLQITTPENDAFIDGFRQYSGAIDIQGTCHEQVKLREVTVTCKQGDQVRERSLNFANGPPNYTVGGINIHGLVFEGENHLTITAEDFGGNTDVVTRDIYYHPLTDDAELLVVTPREFYDALIPLDEWKNASGISSHVISLETIQADNRFSPSRDMPERVKRALAHAYNRHNTRYVMLVGDADKFPVRYHKTGRLNVSWGVCWPATELYYASLFKEDGTFDDWDGNGDGLIGQWWQGTEGQDATSFNQVNMDGCNLHPDVALGRVPASTISEVANYVYKVVEYEMNGRQAWFDNLVLWNGSSDFRNDAAELDDVSATYLSGFSPLKHYRPAGWESWDLDTKRAYEHGEWAPAIADDLNQGAGMAVCLDHGADWSMGVFTAQHVSNLANTDRWPVVVAGACDTAKFTYINGYYKDVGNNIPPDPQDGWGGPETDNPEPAPIQPLVVNNESMAERLLCYNLSGAVGFLGAHQGVNNASPPYIRGFLRAWAEGENRLGDMWVFAVDRFVDYYLESGHAFGKSPFQSHHVHKYVLFGDPSLRLGRVPIQAIANIPTRARPDIARLRAQVQQLPALHRPDSYQIRCPRFSDDGSITISGKTKARGTVTATEQTKTVGQAQADAQGNFEINLTNLVDGIHVVHLQTGPPNPQRIAAALRKSESPIVRFEVQLRDPTVSNLAYPESCPGNRFMVRGETQYDGTLVELRENGRAIFSDRSRNGGHFVLRPVKPITEGEHTMSLYLETGAGRSALVEDCITATIGGSSKPVQPTVPPTRPALPNIPARPQ